MKDPAEKLSESASVPVEDARAILTKASEAPKGYRAPRNRAERRAAEKAGVLKTAAEIASTEAILADAASSALSVTARRVELGQIVSETEFIGDEESGRFFIASLVPNERTVAEHLPLEPLSTKDFEKNPVYVEMLATREAMEVWLIGELEAAIDAITGGNIVDMKPLNRWEPPAKTGALAGFVMVEYSVEVTWTNDEEEFDVDDARTDEEDEIDQDEPDENFDAFAAGEHYSENEDLGLEPDGSRSPRPGTDEFGV